jgi:hypothetical protein
LPRQRLSAIGKIRIALNGKMPIPDGVNRFHQNVMEFTTALDLQTVCR